MITADTNLAVVGEAEDETQARQLATTLDPDVIVLDGGVSVSDGVGNLKQTLVVVVDDATAAANWVTYTYANVGGVVHKDAPADQLVEAVRRAFAGDGYISPVLGGALFNVVRSHLPRSRPEVNSYSPLTRRERDVLSLVQCGLQNKEIARQLGISEKTVKFHVSNLLAKCQMSSRNVLIACTRTEWGLSPA